MPENREPLEIDDVSWMHSAQMMSVQMGSVENFLGLIYNGRPENDL
jgi:hypothetical protein